MKTYKDIVAVTKAWAKPRGISGRKGSTYLYVDDEGRTKLYRPYWSGGRAIQGWRRLGYYLEEQGIVAAIYDPVTTEFRGYELRRNS